jgi:hypothetical protein
LVTLDQWEILVLLVNQETVVLQALLVLPVWLVFKVLQEPLVLKVKPDILEKLEESDHQVHKENVVLVDQLEVKDRKVVMATGERLVPQETVVYQEILEVLDLLACKDLLDQEVLLDLRVNQDHKVQEAREVFKDDLEIVVFLENQEELEIRENEENRV